MALEQFTKQPYEEFVIAGEFSAVLATGETLSNPTMTAINKKTLEDTSAEVIESGTVAVSGTQVVGRVKAGVHKETHKITIRTETSDQNKWEIDVLMKVVET
jgi:hypothetical protein